MDSKSALPLGTGVAMVRSSQWLLALASSFLFTRGFRHLRTTFDMDTRIHVVPILVCP